MVTLLIIGMVLLLTGFFTMAIYNRLTKSRILVKEAWSGISTFLQQRSDLIPNLVETVKGYAVHENKTLTEVVKWRNQLVAANSHAEQMTADNSLKRALSGFFAVAEQYPELNANTNFLRLQGDLRFLEEKLSQSRRYYNGTVRDYNQAIAVFPNNLLAGIFQFTPEIFFQETSGASDVPKVAF
jgi:LemA protein